MWKKKGRVGNDSALERKRRREKLDIMPLAYGNTSFALRFNENPRLKFLSEL
jgi:hypothetical protein